MLMRALKLRIHFHMLFLNGVSVGDPDCPRFWREKALIRVELEFLVHTISKRGGQYMERQGLLPGHV